MNQERRLPNSLLLADLNAYISEDQISSAIIKLGNEVNSIESVCGPSFRTSNIRDEIAKLEEQLDNCNNRGIIRSQLFCKTISM